MPPPASAECSAFWSVLLVLASSEKSSDRVRLIRNAGLVPWGLAAAADASDKDGSCIMMPPGGSGAPRRARRRAAVQSDGGEAAAEAAAAAAAAAAATPQSLLKAWTSR
jgi:hypothetical protein